MAIEPDPPSPSAAPVSRPLVEPDAPGAPLGQDEAEDLVPELSGHAPPEVRSLRTQAIRSGAVWLVWIAVLTVVNVVATASGSDFSFALGFVLSQIVTLIGTGVATESGMPAIAWAAAAVGSIPALVFGGLWFLAREGRAWVFLAAIVAYGIDLVALVGILLVVGEMDIIGIGIHVWALWALWRGWTACQEPPTA